MLTLPIRDVLPATPRARVVRIALNGEPFVYEPGQAVLVASHGREPRRPYSIAAAPEDTQRHGCLELLVGVDAEGRAGAHLSLEAGALVDVEGPVGRFTFPENPSEHDFVFVAGGTGIAPLRAMMQRALIQSRNRIGLLYSARTPSDFAYEGELRALAQAGRIELRQTVTRESAPAGWTGGLGRIGRNELEPLVHDPATLCFICGPPALVSELPALLGELGIPRERIRTEEWG